MNDAEKMQQKYTRTKKATKSRDKFDRFPSVVRFFTLVNKISFNHSTVVFDRARNNKFIFSFQQTKLINYGQSAGEL